MKKIIFSVTSAFCFFALTQSCNRQENLPPGASAIDEKEPTSVIDQMEKERGVKFFKKDVWFNDVPSGSEILMRFASSDESVLNYYLDNFEYDVKPTFANENVGDVKPHPEIVVADNTQGKSNNHITEGMITEPLTLNLKNGAVGYHISVRGKKVTSSKGKIAYQDSFWQHVSHTKPNTWSLRVFNGSPAFNNGINTINVGLEYRHHWYSSWRPFYPWQQYSSYTNTHRDFGPYGAGAGEFNKVIARVYFDPIGVVSPQQGFDLWFN